MTEFATAIFGVILLLVIALFWVQLKRRSDLGAGRDARLEDAERRGSRGR